MEQDERRWDVIVVGGGPADLAGDIALLRSRRSVLVIDDGQPRNAPAGHVHNFLTRDGTPPVELLAAGRAEVVAYGGTMLHRRVRSAAARDDGFEVVVDGGTAGPNPLQARRLLVTTGLTDRLPTVPGLSNGGVAMCCTARTAMAGTSETRLSACSADRWVSIRHCCSAS